MDVVRVGGSLMGQSDDTLHFLSSAPVLIVPGGGPFADTVRDVDAQFGLAVLAAHRMAILGMEQYAWFIADRTGLPLTHNPQAPLPAIFLLARWLEKNDPFAPSWNVTSDSIAAWVAHCLGLSRVLLLKDVSGIWQAGRIIAEIPATSLQGNTCVDAELPRCLRRWQLTAWVLDGRCPEPLTQALRHEPVGTRILPV